MPLPAIREKISQLPRSYKLLFLFLAIIILILVVESTYYLWMLRSKTEESRYIDTDVTYQEGVYLYSRGVIAEEEGEPMAIRGKVIKVDGWFLTVEGQGQQAIVEIDKDFEYSKITERPKGLSPNLKWAEEMLKEGVHPEVIRQEFIERGLVVASERPKISDLSQLIKVGDFVVVSKIRTTGNGMEKGSFLSVLEFPER